MTTSKKSGVLCVVLFITQHLFAQWGVSDTRTDVRNDAGASGAGIKSGFYETTNPVNFPAGAAGWWHLMDVRHSTAANNYAMQFAGSFFDQRLYFRKTEDNASKPWSRILTEIENATVVGEKLILQTPFAQASNWTRGTVSQNINWNWETDKWRVGIQAPGDFSMMRYENGGDISFFNGSWSNNPIEVTNTDLNNYKRMVITTGGNIGIGVSVPEARIHIADGVGGEQLRLSRGTGVVRFAQEGDKDNLYLYNSDASKVYMFWKEDGNVGIGTSDPKGYKLAVAGKMIAEKIVVKAQASWPDYVFDSSYKIRTLAEVEQFIQQNKHLPEIPSAAEIKEKGIDVGDNQAVLLKKIEELTLYIIEQNKQLEEMKKIQGLQQKQIDALKSGNNK